MTGAAADRVRGGAENIPSLRSWSLAGIRTGG
jgi:hypothetical protein